MSPAEHDRVTREGGQLAVAMITAATSGQVDLAAKLHSAASPEVAACSAFALLMFLEGALTVADARDPGFQQGYLRALGVEVAAL